MVTKDLTKLQYLEDGMTNFDHSIPNGLEEQLKQGDCWCNHTAWDFRGNVWYENGMFHEAVYCYHSFQAEYQSDTLEELMVVVNDEHGAD
ncbi:hypothetical protein LCGC14_1380100 [marine sediment metagenome]|uniref:Uncharacterized protein n=1 Tax=marine sediment metagenome TaxID=412755 RepID=A0A0F9K319_9ZZZZ